jgi:hypothetical protein
VAGRIRTIKPELLAILRFAELSDAALRLFLCCYMLVDDEGLCPAGATYLNGQIFYASPRHKTVIGRLLSELESAKLIDLYEVDRAPYLAIVGWFEKEAPTHQRIDKPQGARFPRPSSRRSWNAFVDGSDAIRSEERGADSDPLLSAASAAPSPADWMPAGTKENAEACDPAIEKGVDLDLTLRKFRDHAAKKKLSAAELDARWRRWIRAEKAPAEEERRSYQRIANLANGTIVFGERIGDARYDDGPDEGTEIWHRTVVKMPNGLFRECSIAEDDEAIDIEQQEFLQRRRRYEKQSA